MTPKQPSLIEARLDHRAFVAFHLDVGIGDAVTAEPEWVTDQNLLGFAGIPPVRVTALAREQRFAEKLHAYTLPRGERANTRVKDLVNLAQLIDLGLLKPEPSNRRFTRLSRGAKSMPSLLTSRHRPRNAVPPFRGFRLRLACVPPRWMPPTRR